MFGVLLRVRRHYWIIVDKFFDAALCALNVESKLNSTQPCQGLTDGITEGLVLQSCELKTELCMCVII